MKDYKIGLIVFLFLSCIISLWLPFEWGNEIIRTEDDGIRFRKRYIIESLPIKKYDFLFASNKRYLPIGSTEVKWYLLKRELILNEVILEYLLAGFIAFLMQTIISLSKSKKLN